MFVPTLVAFSISMSLVQVQPRIARVPANQGTRQVMVKASDTGFSPDTISVIAGSKVRLVMINVGKMPHAIAVDLPRRARISAPAVRPGQRRTLEFRAPTSTTQIKFFDPLHPNMAGVMTVVAISGREMPPPVGNRHYNAVITASGSSLRTISVAPAQRFSVTLTNRTSEALTVDFMRNPQSGAPSMVLPPGSARTMSFVAPRQAGAYFITGQSAGKTVFSIRVVVSGPMIR